MSTPPPDEMPADPVGPLAEWAGEVHEHFLALTEAGFTPKQAEAIMVAGVHAGWFSDLDADSEL